ncbi:MAG TPA: serine/threonine-protein kinase [Vicinamibacterales bacterium]|nr:serine/threonine-protein kinase [Vicinamibacterales bacterium]
MTQVHPVCSVCGVARTDDSPACTSCGHAFSDDDAATGTHAPFFDSARANAETLAGVPVSPRGTGPLIAGQAFGPRYHIIRTLGAGGMGVVYQAWDAELNVAVAVKVIRPEVIGDRTSAAEVERRFKRELVLARQVTHRNVVRIHDLGERDGIKYLTMPFVEGQDLANLLRERGRLPVPEALAIARQVAHGLAAAHQVGVVHRDLKPENIMLAADGTALIMDFGISRSISGTATATALGGVMGTLEYMAPEQARGELVDPRADIYAFGLIFYDMLTGRQRLAGRDNPMSEIMSRMHAAPRPLRQLDDTIPESLERIIARCIEPSAEKRFATTSELVATLEALTPDGHPLTLARTPWALIARYCTTIVPFSAGFESSKWSWYVHVPALAKACVTFVCPAPIVPSPASIDGQLPCWGCGSDAISCDRVSLFTIVTDWPTATVTDFAVTPEEEIVIVAPLAPVPPSRTTTVTPPLGELGEPPQPATSATRARDERTDVRL